MRQDWIEFHRRYGGDKISLRLENIVEIIQKPIDKHNNIAEYTQLGYESGHAQFRVDVAEHYETAKQKIIDAKRTYYPAIVKDCSFTKDEYLMLYEWASEEHYYIMPRSQGLQESICDKLRRILKEDE